MTNPLSHLTPLEREQLVIPEHVWYMRDNHTFRKLSGLSLDAALGVIGEEFACGNSYGMLCHKRESGPNSLGASGHLGHFLVDAEPWLIEVCRAEYEAMKAEMEQPDYREVARELAEALVLTVGHAGLHSVQMREKGFSVRDIAEAALAKFNAMEGK